MSIFKFVISHSTFHIAHQFLALCGFTLGIILAAEGKHLVTGGVESLPHLVRFATGNGANFFPEAA